MLLWGTLLGVRGFCTAWAERWLGLRGFTLKLSILAFRGGEGVQWRGGRGGGKPPPLQKVLDTPTEGRRISAGHYGLVQIGADLVRGQSGLVQISAGSIWISAD